MDRVCPLLALVTDDRTAVDGVDGAHACHALDEPMPLERRLQAQLCLTPRHDRCERLLQHVARRGGTPGRSAVADGLVSTRMVLAAEPAWRGIAGRARGGRPGRALAVGGAVVAASIAGVAVAGPAMNGGLTLLDEPAQPSTSATPTAALPSLTDPATPLPSVSPSPSATVTPVASASPSPTPVVTLTPTVAPTAVPTPTPQPVRTYVVLEGDTLAAIAQQFGSTVEAIQAANGIEDPDEIVIGQTLVIP